MVKIDLEKFICSMIAVNDYSEFIYGKALKDQGLEYKDGQIVESASEEKIPHEPKFKKGDWIVHDMSDGRKVIRQIVDMTNKSYILNGKDFNVFYFNDLENDYHKWTIQDAKDGDVLVSPLREQIFIFKKIDNREYVDNCIEYYCRVYQDIFYVNIQGYMGTSSETFYPATKEQHDLLFQKMREAGYEWDIKKKELKKIQLDGTIKFEESVEELTEFEETFYLAVKEWYNESYNPAVLKKYVLKLLTIARKQIAEEIDVDKMVKAYIEKLEKTPDFRHPHISMVKGYSQAINDTLEKIKGE